MGFTFERTASDFLNYASLMSNAHYDLAEFYRLQHRKFGLIVVLITSISGAAALVSLTKLVEPPQDWWVKLGVGLLSLTATVLSALQTFLAFSVSQEQHKKAGDGYSVARRSLQKLLTAFPTATGQAGSPGSIELDEVSKALDELDKSSPTVPDSVYDRIRRRTPQVGAA